jgi:hypothetical protein
MTTNKTRSVASEIAQRIKTARMDPSQIDEADRPPSDRPPAFAEVLMSTPPTIVEGPAKLSKIDWDVIELALVHYAACEGGA